MGALIQFGSIVPCLIQNISQFDDYSISNHYLNLLRYIAGTEYGRELIYNQQGLDKLILLLYDFPPENTESLLVEILALFYNQGNFFRTLCFLKAGIQFMSSKDKYHHIINMKSDIATLQNLIEEKELIRKVRPQVKVTGVQHTMEPAFFKKPTFCGK